MKQIISIKVNDELKGSIVVTKATNIKSIKSQLKKYDYDSAHFYINDKTESKVFNTTKYDGITLDSVWKNMKNPTIYLDIEKIYLPKDILEKLGHEMIPKDLINFCQSQITPELKKLCNDNSFWYRRFKKDFDFFTPYIFDLSTNSKERYFQIFFIISKAAETLRKDLIGSFLKNLEKYLTQEYKDDLYLVAYNYILNNAIFVVKNGENSIDEEMITELVVEFTTRMDMNKIHELLPDSSDDDFFENYFSDIMTDNVDPAMLKIVKYLKLFPDENDEDNEDDEDDEDDNLRLPKIGSPPGSPQLRLPKVGPPRAILPTLGSPRH